MVGTPEGHVESIHKEEATPMNDLNDEVGWMQGPRLTCRWSSRRPDTKSSRKHDSSSRRNAQSSIERSSAMEMVGVHAPRPTM